MVGLDPLGDAREVIGVGEVEAESLGAVAFGTQRARLLLGLGLGPR